MKIRVKLYDVYIFLIVFLKGLGATAESKAYLLAFMLGCAVIALKIFQEKFTVREICSMLFILMAGALSYVLGNETTVLFTAIALCGAKNVDTHRIIKLAFWTMLSAFLIMIIGSLSGVIENTAVRFWRTDRYIYRYTFGYKHPNTVHILFTALCFLYLYLYEGKTRAVSYVLLAGLNYLMFMCTYSRTGMVMGYICILLSLLLRFKKTKNVVLVCSKYIYHVLFIISIFFGVLYGRSDFVGRIDELLSGRIYYTHVMLSTYVPPLFGKADYQAGIIDNGYIALLYHGGLLAFGWIMFYHLKLGKLLVEKKKYRESFLLICFAMYAMAESFFMTISLNISLVLIVDVLFSVRKEKRSDDNNNLYANIQPSENVTKTV